MPLVRDPPRRLRGVLHSPHRPQHSAELHGNGAHLDNLETHDERLILPHTCFSVEPGIYLKDFGIRSEVNMMTEPACRGHRPIQTELVRDLADSSVSLEPGFPKLALAYLGRTTGAAPPRLS